jgi:hypothetical protein
MSWLSDPCIEEGTSAIAGSAGERDTTYVRAKDHSVLKLRVLRVLKVHGEVTALQFT